MPGSHISFGLFAVGVCEEDNEHHVRRRNSSGFGTDCPKFCAGVPGNSKGDNSSNSSFVLGDNGFSEWRTGARNFRDNGGTSSSTVVNTGIMISRREFLLRSAATGVGLSVFSKRVAAVETQKILELAGTRVPSSTTYTRMFPNLPPQGGCNRRLEEGLIALGESMRDDSNEPPDCKDTPPAGYTYLGQFIDHDLTLDVTPLDAA